MAPQLTVDCGLLAVSLFYWREPLVTAVGVRGGANPAVSDPKPRSCKLRALSFPLARNPFASWKAFIASTLALSHFPVGVAL